MAQLPGDSGDASAFAAVKRPAARKVPKGKAPKTVKGPKPPKLKSPAGPSVYACGTFAEFFRGHVEACRERDTAFSLRQLARRLKLRSPSLLAMVARGEREPTPALLHRLCAHLGLSAAESRYAELLVGLRRAKDIEEQLRCAKELKRLKPANSELILELETFEMIAKWYTHVVIEMTKLGGFRDDPSWISHRLGSTVSVDMVRETLEVLERHGILSRGAGGRLTKATQVVRSSVNVPSTAIRSFHKQVLLRAHQAIERQAISERYFTTMTLAVPQHRIADAGRLISQFRDEFMATMAVDQEPADEIYHLGVQFFRATEKSAT